MTDDHSFDEQLRAWGRAQREAAPELSLPENPVRARRTVAVLGAAAAVVALIVGVTVWTNRAENPVVSPAPQTEVTTTSPLPSTALSSSSDGSSAPLVAGTDGLQNVNYKGLQVSVPASWTMNDTYCGTPMSDTVSTQQFTLACLMPRPVGVSAVSFWESAVVTDGSETTSVTLGGDRPLQATRSEGRLEGDEEVATVTISVPDLAVRVEISSADRALVEQIAASLQYSATDDNGCLSEDAADIVLPSQPADPAVFLLPGSAPAMICRYQDDLLRFSAALSTDETDRLSGILAQLKPGGSPASDNCAAEDPRVEGDNHLRIRSGDRTITVVLSGCVVDVTDGTGVARVSPDLFEFLTRSVGLDAGFSANLIPPPSSAPPTP